MSGTGLIVSIIIIAIGFGMFFGIKAKDKGGARLIGAFIGSIGLYLLLLQVDSMGAHAALTTSMIVFFILNLILLGAGGIGWKAFIVILLVIVGFVISGLLDVYPEDFFLNRLIGDFVNATETWVKTIWNQTTAT